VDDDTSPDEQVRGDTRARIREAGAPEVGPAAGAPGADRREEAVER
jgi:hypothetical protein